MTTEFGIFNDEGCCEAGFYSKEEAEKAIVARYRDGDEVDASVYVAECCHDHPGETAVSCAICNKDEDEEH